jgi:hypothetical protein
MCELRIDLGASMGGDGVCAPAIRALRVHQLGTCVHWTGTHPKVAPLAAARTEDLAVITHMKIILERDNRDNIHTHNGDDGHVDDG